MKKLFLICLILIFFIFIVSKPLPDLKNNKEKTNIHPKPPYLSKEQKEYSKEYFDNLVLKGLKSDNLTKGFPPYLFYEKINYKEDILNRKNILDKFKTKKNRRRLYDKQNLENLGFVDLYQDDNYGNVLYALKFLMNSIKKEDTKFILYPYPFNYMDKNNEEKNVQNGGFFSLNESLLDGGKFNYLQNISSVQIGKAKGIYDVDIAIMSIVYTFNGRETDLFTEASLFCDYFVNQLNKLTSCLDGKKDYLEYKSYYPNKGAVVRVSEKDILENILFDPETGHLKFKLLIIPDYLTGNEETLLSLFLNQEAIEKIQNFRNLGGHIITSGKSGYLLELMGLIPSDTYDNSITFHTNSKDSTNSIHGCEDIYKNDPDEQSDYLKELICMGFKSKTYLSQAFPIKNIPSNFESLIQYTNEEKTLVYKQNGYQFDINDVNAKYDYILISNEETGKGRIMLVNGSPIKEMKYLDNVRNMILYSMTKNVIFDLKIKFTPSNSEEDIDLPIPAGEEGVQLLASYKLYNLDDHSMTDVEIDILVAQKVEIKLPIDGCEIKADDKYKNLNISYIDNSKYIKCSISTLNKLSKNTNSFTVEITDFTITQLLNDIPLMYSNITYTDTDSKRK